MVQTIDNIRSRILETSVAESSLQAIINQRRPCSVIRLGDGEGVVLAKPSLSHPLLGPYLVSHFGPSVTQAQVDSLSLRLQEGCSRAFMVGVRPDILDNDVEDSWFDLAPSDFLERFLRSFKLRPHERKSINYANSYRLALLNMVLANGLLTANTELTSAWCHFEWSRSGFLADLVHKESRIGLISRHRDLAGLIEKHGTEVDYYPIPARYIRSDSNWTPHYPDRFDQILNSMEVAFKGQVFLVGAGICGKVYCDEIALRGGIAIDIGSVCDSWLGVSSRPLVMQSMFETDTVPVELTLEYQLGHLQ